MPPYTTIYCCYYYYQFVYMLFICLYCIHLFFVNFFLIKLCIYTLYPLLGWCNKLRGLRSKVICGSLIGNQWSYVENTQFLMSYQFDSSKRKCQSKRVCTKYHSILSTKKRSSLIDCIGICHTSCSLSKLCLVKHSQTCL